jgi:hypothetical protein
MIANFCSAGPCVFSARNSFKTIVLLCYLCVATAIFGQTATTTTVAVSSQQLASDGFVYTATASINTATGPVTVGAVDFLDSGKLLATVQVIQTSAAGLTPGTASFRKPLGPGAHSIVARFRGTATLGLSTSPAVPVTVAGTTTNTARLAQAATYSLGGNFPTFQIALADVNNDGLPDIVVPKFSDGNIQILLNDPSNPGSFLSPQILTPPLTSHPYQVVVTDLDGDGLPDILITSANDGAIFYFLQNSANPGNFLPASVVGVPNISNPSFAVADIDGDGIPDIVAVGITSSTSSSGNYGIVTLLQLAANRGHFAAPVTLDSGTGSFSTIALADMDLNGTQDIVIGSVNPGDVRVYSMDTAHPGKFTKKTDYPSAVPFSLQVSDINHDGLPDVVIGSVTNPGVQILLNDPANPGGLLAPSSYPVTDRALDVAISDLDGDGNPDIVGANFSNSFSVLMGNGKGTLASVITYNAGGTATTQPDGSKSSEVEGIASADLDGDGLDDVVAPLWFENKLVVFLHKVVQKAALSLTSDKNSYTALQPATYTATLSNTTPILNIPISFMDSGVLLATTFTNASGVASYQVPILHGGTHSITAVDATDGVTTSALTLLASPNPTTLTLTTTPTAPTAGQTLSLNAAVASQSTATIPTGSITITDSGVNIGSATLDSTGKATFTTSALAAGTHNFVATYAGTADFGGSTASSTITIVAPDYVLSANPSSLTIVAAQSGSTTLTLTPQNGFVDVVQLSCGSLPQNISCSFSNITPSLSGTAPQTVQLTLSTRSVSALDRNTAYPSSPSMWLAFLIAPFLFGIRLTTKNLKRLSIVVSILALTGITILSGCSGGNKGATSGTGNALPGTYTVVVNALSQHTAASHAVNITLTVQ